MASPVVCIQLVAPSQYWQIHHQWIMFTLQLLVCTVAVFDYISIFAVLFRGEGVIMRLILGTKTSHKPPRQKPPRNKTWQKYLTLTPSVTRKQNVTFEALFWILVSAFVQSSRMPYSPCTACLCVHSSVRPSVRSFVHPSVRSFVRSLVRSFQYNNAVEMI